MGKLKKLIWFVFGLWLGLWAFLPTPPWYIHFLPFIGWILMIVNTKNKDEIIW